LRKILLLLVLVLIAGAVILAWPRLEGDPPMLTGPERVVVGATGARVEVGWQDGGTGLRSVDAQLELAAGDGEPKRIPLHANRYEGSALRGPADPSESEGQVLELDAKALDLPDGTATLVLGARDWAWRDGFDGNAGELRIPVVIDTRAPRLSVESGLTYVRRGGSAAVVYRTDRETVRSGARVGDAWFPGAPTPGGGRIAVFAIPIDADYDPVIEVVAIDEAGNEATGRFDVRVQERRFPEISIALSERFLEGVATRLGETSGMTQDTPLATFQRVNSELRAQSEATIVAAIGEPTARQWSGAFEQMRNSQVTSQFAELRHYMSGSEQVSRARHYGFDLASTARAPITAANAGTVIYAEDNGIYGTLVLIDHGLGITTLYGHLSSLAVAVGDRVEQGQELGRSGATGLAGGDHLHFAVLVGHTYVDPVEWWDPKWVREHIDARLVADATP
jgi:murein DD-endopeptidase MepM/ murein hydrolase activator NlpD